MKILVTVAGHIGSYACVELLNTGHDVVVFDSLSSSQRLSLLPVETTARKHFSFIQGDICNKVALEKSLLGWAAIGLSAGQSYSVPGVIPTFETISKCVEIPTIKP